MEPDRIEPGSFSKRLSTLYANYADAWRTVFPVPGATAATTPKEQPEQRWEGEGGSLKNDA